MKRMPPFIGCCIICIVLNSLCYPSDATDKPKLISLAKTFYANRSESAVMKWQYIPGKSSTLALFICGCYTASKVNNFIEMATKLASGHWILKSGKDVKRYEGRLKMLLKNNVIVMKISNISSKDENRYICKMIYKSASGVLSTFIEAETDLKVTDRPKFIDCLGSTDICMHEGSNMYFSCSVYGYPTPDIACSVFNDRDMNVTYIQRKKSNISRVHLRNIRRDIKFVKCVAENEITGTATITRQITTFYLPSKPRNVIVTKVTPTTIELTWQVPKDQGNAPIINYLVQYGLTPVFLTKKNASIDNMGIKLEGLEGDNAYIIIVTARNKLGLGPNTRKIFWTSKTKVPVIGKRKGSANKLSMSFVIPIAVVAFLFVAVVSFSIFFGVTWCRNEKRMRLIIGNVDQRG